MLKIKQLEIIYILINHGCIIASHEYKFQIEYNITRSIETSYPIKNTVGLCWFHHSIYRWPDHSKYAFGFSQVFSLTSGALTCTKQKLLLAIYFIENGKWYLTLYNIPTSKEFPTSCFALHWYQVKNEFYK